MANLLDLLFPLYCLGCRGEGAWLCKACFTSLADRRLRSIGCPACQTKTDGSFCAVHRLDSALDGLVFVDYFHPGLLREVIHTYKYEGITQLSAPLGLLLRKELGRCPFLNVALAVPLPLHSIRLRERGFNQSELLARRLGMDIFCDALVRVRHRPAQALFSRQKRLLNARGCYAVRRAAVPILTGRKIILVDDVYTTGATLNEAARLLKKAGALSVWGAVIAKDE